MQNTGPTADPKGAGPKPPFEGKTQERPGIEARMEPRPDYGESSYKGLGRLKDRIALITGGDSGIGRAVALAFAREGAHVAISYLSEHEDAKETARVIKEAGREALTLPGDLADEAHCRKVVEEVARKFGRIDVLVNNAAEQGKAVERFEDIDAARLERTFRVNILAMFHMIRYALPHMKEGGSIINVASIQAYQPSPDILDYASTKGAIVTFSKGLAQDLIERGIRVNVVAPGPVWTPLIQQSFDKEKVATFGKNHPMERPAQPAELAPAFVFLASNEASYINGEVLGVTGGKPLS
ncbi:putative Oxidoreductase [Sorangium cellulosum So ce56]|uniref:Oxidoreductase n=1 Tax=Sorangium cellulosum (strain So ce56) TaxID=448385 RepID=A9GQI2_SORC5|nr:putative Oxidoreductase [Sorangium cellulosum So ce56]